MIIRKTGRIMILLFLIPVVLLQTGCWNRRELNTIGIAMILAFDRAEDDKILLTAEIIKPNKSTGGDSGGSGEKEPVIYIQSEGSSVFEALRNATTRFDRKIFLAHNKILIISEKLARERTFNISDFFQRDHEIRETLNVLIAKGNASEMLGWSSGIEDIPGFYLERIIKNQGSSSKAVASRGFEIFRDAYMEGLAPVIASIELRENSNTIKAKAESNDFEISLEGLAVFKDNLKGFLDGIETKSYNLVRGKVKSGVIVAPLGSLLDVSSIEILSSGSDIQVELADEEIKINVNVNIKGMLVEETAKIRVKDPDVIKQIEKIATNVVTNQIENTIKKLQEEYKADIFGFGQIVHRKYPKAWKTLKGNWDEHFSRARVTVKVEVSILQTGLISDNSRMAGEE